MKTRIKYIVACIIAVLLTACLPKEFCNPVDFSENCVNVISDILCESNHLCGKKSNIDWNKEGQWLKVGYAPVFFKIDGNDTLPLGIENNRFYVCSLSESRPPAFFSGDSSYNYILRISLREEMADEEKDAIYEFLETTLLHASYLTLKGEIRFYKSEEDPYFESKHDYVPELVISNINDIFIK